MEREGEVDLIEEGKERDKLTLKAGISISLGAGDGEGLEGGFYVVEE